LSEKKPEVIVGSALSGEGFDEIARQLNLSSSTVLGKDREK
jgi:DNA-binding NarL/FixJ family response regulator